MRAIATPLAIAAKLCRAVKVPSRASERLEWLQGDMPVPVPAEEIAKGLVPPVRRLCLSDPLAHARPGPLLKGLLLRLRRRCKYKRRVFAHRVVVIAGGRLEMLGARFAEDRGLTRLSGERL